MSARSVRHIVLLTAACLALLTGPAAAAAGEAPGISHPDQVFWGDTHLHSRNSADAYSLGNQNLSPEDAYRFARGEPLLDHSGEPIALRRPLDFLIVSDHAEYLGGYYGFTVGDPRIKNSEMGKRWTEWMAEGDAVRMMGSFVGSINSPKDFPPFEEPVRRSIWQQVARTADEFNDPHQFTTFTGYEWTSMINGNNLHRVVLFEDSAERVGLTVPFSAQDSTDPRDLWRALAGYEASTGGRVLAIAHNGNLSNGMMFPKETVDGEPLDAAYAALRRRFEPVYEVSQVKGDGEAHPTLSPDDPFADFENWDWDNIGRTAEKEDWMLQHEYARGALKLGLALEASLGENPFQFGMIGSTDGHNTFTTTAEDAFYGKFPESEPSPERTRDSQVAGVLWNNALLTASGYAAIWATENTRQGLFDALLRREVYATTGSRITLRFFGGFELDPAQHELPDAVARSYADGVPMGGMLTARKKTTAPRFLVMASKDPIGANLDRVQIVKGWRTANGSLKEKIYDVALAGDRQPDPQSGIGKVIGTTVDIEAATYRNSIGASTLAATWQDPDFRPGERAFYYARVLEIPTPRWSTYDAARFKIDRPDNVPATIQDRAYSSPIWYQP